MIINIGGDRIVGTGGSGVAGRLYFATLGNSNFAGKATTNSVAATPTGGKTSQVFCLAGNSQAQAWITHTEDSTAGSATAYMYAGGTHGYTYPLLADAFTAGSMFGSAANSIMAAGFDVGWIPCAKAGTTMSDWQVPVTDYDITTLVGTACSRMRDAAVTMKAALVELGTNNDGISQVTYATYLDALVTKIYTLFGCPTMLCYCNPIGNTNAHAATTDVLNGNAHAVAGPDFSAPSPAWSGLHYLTTAEINEAGGVRLFAAMHALGWC